ncbi:FSCB, partial [Cervus elaphus hippelaphus]
MKDGSTTLDPVALDHPPPAPLHPEGISTDLQLSKAALLKHKGGVLDRLQVCLAVRSHVFTSLLKPQRSASLNDSPLALVSELTSQVPSLPTSGQTGQYLSAKMEEKDESEQSISAGRQEIRKRRRPSQPMVDKSQQTEVTEKKKQLSIPQSSGPKVALSIGNIPGSKLNYECHRVSSQLQQTWIKRKRVQDMADKSLQTETIAEEKKEEIKLVCEAVVPEEKPAAVEVGPEFPESVQEVEVPPSRYSAQVKTDRSQQTSCTGDWTMMNFPQKDKLDKEQQTYFSESEIVAIGWSTNSFSKSKEGAQKRKSSGSIFVSEHPEFQPTTSSNEETRRQTEEALEKEAPEVQSVSAGQAPAEEGLGFQSPPADKAPEEEAPEVQSPPVDKGPEEEGQGLQSLPAEEAPEEEAPEVQSPPVEEAPEEAAPEIQSLPAEEAPAEEPPEVQPPPTEEAPAEETPAELQSPSTEETTSEMVSVEKQPSFTEEPFITPISLEETSAEVLLPPSVQTPADEALVENVSPVDQAPNEADVL